MLEYVIMSPHASAEGSPMTTMPQHVSQSLDHQEPNPEEKPQANFTSRGVMQRPIWEVIVEVGEHIPDDEWANVPSDASIHYKYYLYGMSKKNG